MQMLYELPPIVSVLDDGRLEITLTTRVVTKNGPMMGTSSFTIRKFIVEATEI